MVNFPVIFKDDYIGSEKLSTHQKDVKIWKPRVSEVNLKKLIDAVNVNVFFKKFK